MNKKTLLVFGILLIASFAIFTFLRRDLPKLHHLSGQTMGTIVYNVKFMGKGDEVTKSAIDEVLIAFNQSLSTYLPDSEISKLNQTGGLVYTSDFFYPVLVKSGEIYQKTAGAFDPTVGPLIQAWGFGPDKTIPTPDSTDIDSLLRVVGFDQVRIDEKQVSLPPSFQLDFSAIAKGYAVDRVAELLEKQDLQNYMVEIGGEVRSKGLNNIKKTWSLGIEDPTVKEAEQRLMAIVRLKDRSLATSGNYRNYYEKEGVIFAHIVDPRTGYTSSHNLLSASVFADDCMTADAYATAFMVMGLEESKQMVDEHEIDAVLIYRAADASIKSYVSEGIAPFIELNKAK